MKFSSNEESRGLWILGMLVLLYGVGIDGAEEVDSEKEERSVFFV